MRWKTAIALLLALLLLSGCAGRPNALELYERTVPDAEGIDRSLLVETGPQYAINVQAPVTRSARINGDVRDLVNDVIDEFIANASEPSNAEFGDSQLIIEYETHRWDDTRTTFVFEIYYYMAGAAHGNSYALTRTYSLTSGDVIRLSDLFVSGADYLGRLSQLSRRELAQGQLGEMYDQEWVEEGTAPLEENFARFVPMPNGLMIIFDPYQVGPWAIGEQRVTIPWSDMGDIVR